MRGAHTLFGALLAITVAAHPQQGQQTSTWVTLRRLSGERDMLPNGK